MPKKPSETKRPSSGKKRVKVTKETLEKRVKQGESIGDLLDSSGWKTFGDWADMRNSGDIGTLLVKARKMANMNDLLEVRDLANAIYQRKEFMEKPSQIAREGLDAEKELEEK